MLRIAIFNGQSELLTYPIANFIADLAKLAGERKFFIKNQKDREMILIRLAEDLIRDFKKKTATLPIGIEDR
jgi:hypothetical protein